MLLAVDIGNSNIVIGCIEDDGEIVDIFRMKTDISKTDDEYAVNLDSILRIGGIDREKISGSIISSVVPPLTNLMRSVIRRLTGTTALVVGAGVKTGLNVMIETPASLGADIVAGSVAAMTEYPLPVIVIDMGTATTIVTVDQHGNYIGGAILPGVAISMDALSGGTSQLQRVPIEAPKKCINGITVDAMKSGAVFGTASMIDGMIDRFEEELGTACSVVATGGLAPMIIPHCKHPVICDENLLLRGLAIIYGKNRKK